MKGANVGNEAMSIPNHRPTPTLFIGGPWDGKIHTVPAHLEHWQVEENTNPLPCTIENSMLIAQQDSIRTHIYRRERLACGHIIEIFIHEEFSVHEALLLVFTAYNQTRHP